MPEITPSKYRVDATWDDAPHLSEDDKEELWASIPVHQRDARAKGIPQLGAGAIWPVVEERIIVDPFPIPEYWPLAFALDVGWKVTAALWGAWDRATDTVYIWHEYKAGQVEPATHIEAIKAPGAWIPGVIDPAARGRSQRDGMQLIEDYQGSGLDITAADNAVQVGLHTVFKRLASARLKVFSTCRNFFDEYRLYRRDENGAVVKDNDHLCDCLRYLIMSGMAQALCYEVYLDKMEQRNDNVKKYGNRTTGY